ncbi:MAG TPA: RidA family protein [Bacteroidia bacterium]|nr:RidA family protein [Bacteroidia bacterium]HRS58112.1 RidA family protein [Bacteroidia bacterium]HRU66867.1 RidA family protein [Bacteroidia bacterium]
MKTVIFTEKAPRPIGPYSQAIKFENMLFISGQIAINPETGQLIEGDIQQQTHQVFNNLSEILKAAGYSFQDVVKVSVFLTDIRQFSTVNQIYSTYFTEKPPAREILQACALPMNAGIEISVIALKNSQ